MLSARRSAGPPRHGRRSRSPPGCGGCRDRATGGARRASPPRCASPSEHPWDRRTPGRRSRWRPPRRGRRWPGSPPSHAPARRRARPMALHVLIEPGDHRRHRPGADRSDGCRAARPAPAGGKAPAPRSVTAGGGRRGGGRRGRRGNRSGRRRRRSRHRRAGGAVLRRARRARPHDEGERQGAADIREQGSTGHGLAMLPTAGGNREPRPGSGGDGHPSYNPAFPPPTGAPWIPSCGCTSPSPPVSPGCCWRRRSPAWSSPPARVTSACRS